MEFLKYIGTIANQNCLVTTGCRAGYKFESDSGGELHTNFKIRIPKGEDEPFFTVNFNL